MERFINMNNFPTIMEISNFKSERTGKVVSVSGTTSHCFEPKELPFKIDYNPELVKLISKAASSLGSLSEAGRKLKNPHLLIRPYMRKEAVLSSKIEGTRTTLSEVFIHEAQKKKKPGDDLGEVMNYVRALQYGLSKIQESKLSVELIKGMHKILLKNVRGEDKDPGEFKKAVNWIGTSYDVMEARFVPCAPENVERLMNNLIDYLNNYDKEDPLFKIAIGHYQFETIHPFRDGNGRLGRLLIILYLCQEKLISQPLFYISAFFEKYREDYDERLEKVSTLGELEGWLKFFLTAVNAQAKDATTRVGKMEELREKYGQILSEKSQSNTAIRIMDFLFENPYITIPEIKERIKSHYAKAKYNVEILLEAGIIEEVPRKAGVKLFVAKEIKEILEV
jgi:Fic family protein